MEIDAKHSDRYLICYPDGRIGRGWEQGIDWTQREGSPPVRLDHDPMLTATAQANCAPSYELDRLWPDTVHYDQNSPGIMAAARDRDRRCYPYSPIAPRLKKAFWLNVLRVPLSASYLTACALVRPMTILELGTGGDSAHSTGMFLLWLSGESSPRPQLVSVDRHYLSHSWLRYRHRPEWTFVQGDSVLVMKQLAAGKIPALPKRYGMIFIDSSHLYQETLAEIRQASLMTEAILFDDSTVHDVARAIDEFMKESRNWLRCDLHPGVTFLERHEPLDA